jgi:hypothetical protein
MVKAKKVKKKPAKKKAVKKVVKKVAPKKRGRPVGSKNKKAAKKAVKKSVKKTVKKASTELKTGKRGRPKGSKNKVKKASTESKKKHPHWLPEDYKEPKAHKLLGYCTCKDGTMIMTSDLVSKFIYVCPNCGKRRRTNKLKKERRTESLGMNKNEWLNDGIDAGHHDMPSLNDKVEDIKVIDT